MPKDSEGREPGEEGYTGPAEEEAHTDPPADPPSDPPQHHDHDAECRGRHAAMEERMSSLENALQAVVQFKPDSTPVKKPWTHRGSR